MSIYNSSFSSAGDSERTTKAKARLERIVKEQFTKKEFKTWIKFEVPATFINEKPVCYNFDMGVLMRSVRIPDLYHFIGVEIDDASHGRYKRELKDKQRDELFMRKNNIVTCRIPIDRLYDEAKIDEDYFFDEHIWKPFVKEYFIAIGHNDDYVRPIGATMNNEFAIKLKENAFVKCRNTACSHVAAQHDLTGCNYRTANKARDKCYCNEPFFRSSE